MTGRFSLSFKNPNARSMTLYECATQLEINAPSLHINALSLRKESALKYSKYVLTEGDADALPIEEAFQFNADWNDIAAETGIDLNDDEVEYRAWVLTDPWRGHPEGAYVIGRDDDNVTISDPIWVSNEAYPVEDESA